MTAPLFSETVKHFIETIKIVELISRNIQMHHAAVRSSLVKDKERFAIKAKLRGNQRQK